MVALKNACFQCNFLKVYELMLYYYDVLGEGTQKQTNLRWVYLEWFIYIGCFELVRNVLRITV